MATAISISARSGGTSAFSTFPSYRCHPQVKTRSTKSRRLSSSSSRVDMDPRKRILEKSPKEDHQIIEQTLDWVEGVVIGLNLCPFAEKPFLQDNLRLEVIEGTDQVDILSRVLAECLVRQKRKGTSLMICPDLFPTNFLSFLEVHNMLQDGVLKDNDLTDDIQIAPFHPLFEFEGSGADGIDNFTNRSPFPIFHILREEEVGVAVDALQGDASKVWNRNVKLLEELDEKLSPEQMEQVMTGQLSQETSSVRETVRGVLKDLKKYNYSERETDQF